MKRSRRPGRVRSPSSHHLRGSSIREATKIERDYIPGSNQRGTPRGDGEGEEGLPDGRGHRGVRGSLQGDEWITPKIWPGEGDGHADLRGGDSGGGGWRLPLGPQTSRRNHVHGLPASLDGPTRHARRKAALFFRGAIGGGDGPQNTVQPGEGPRSPALRIPPRVVLAGARPQGRGPVNALRCQGTPQRSPAGEGPRPFRGGCDAVQEQGGGARRLLRGTIRRGRGQA